MSETEWGRQGDLSAGCWPKHTQKNKFEKILGVIRLSKWMGYYLLNTFASQYKGPRFGSQITPRAFLCGVFMSFLFLYVFFVGFVPLSKNMHVKGWRYWHGVCPAILVC